MCSYRKMNFGKNTRSSGQHYGGKIKQKLCFTRFQVHIRKKMFLKCIQHLFPLDYIEDFVSFFYFFCNFILFLFLVDSISSYLSLFCSFHSFHLIKHVFSFYDIIFFFFFFFFSASYIFSCVEHTNVFLSIRKCVAVC